MKDRFFSVLILFLTLCTGFSGLVYEVVWHAYLSNLIGSHARSAAIIVAVFLGGLSAGYAVFGGVSRHRSPAKLLAIYGVAELAIGIWALLFPKLLPLVAGLSLPGNLLPQIFSDIFQCVALIGVPTLLMGGTLPMLTQALSRSLIDSPRLHARIYAINTAGAFAGCLSGGFIILPLLGLPLTVISMGAVNALAGLVILLISRRMIEAAPLSVNTETARSEAGVSAAHPRLLFPTALTVSFIAGFISISLQMIVMRLIGLSAGSSQYAFSMSVSAFILMLALGAWRLSERNRKPVALSLNQLMVALGIVLILMTVPYWPFVSHVTRTLLTSVPLNFVTFHLLLFIMLSLILLPAVGAMGNTLPTLFRIVQIDLSSLGSRVGWLYGINTAGCVLGALVGGYLLLYYLNFFEILQILAILALLSMLLSAWVIERSWRQRSAVFALACAAAILLMPAWPLERLGVGIFRLKKATPETFNGAESFYREFFEKKEVVAYKDDPNTTVAVLKSANNGLSIHVNGKSDGSTAGSDRITTKLLAHIPLLFSQANEQRAAVIGFGTGITAGTALLYPGVKEIDVIEIAPFIREFSPLFDFANGDSSHNPAISWHIEDAYRYLTRKELSARKYDVIISEPSNPWVAGVERLYAQEFYQLVKGRLNPAGIYAQWFHTYSISPEALGLVLNTFHRSWKSVRIFVNDSDLILLGSQQQIGIDALERARVQFSHPKVRQDLKELLFPSLEAILATEISIAPVSFKDAGIQTLDFPKLSHLAGYDFFLDSSMTAEIFAEDARWRQESYQRWNGSLLAQSQISGGGQIDLAGVASVICRTEKPVIVQGWRQLTRPCRQILFAAAARDLIENRAQDAEEVVSMLKVLQSGREQDNAALSVGVRLQKLRILNEYISPWYRPEIEALQRFGQHCMDETSQDALNCRVMLAQAAQWSGHLPLAKTILATIPAEELPRHMRQTYQQLLANVEAAL